MLIGNGYGPVVFWVGPAVVGNNRGPTRASWILVIWITAEALIEFNEEHPADLVVMGSHGRTGLTHFVMGSVASDLVRRASCPVLIVKHPVPETIDDPSLELEPALV